MLSRRLLILVPMTVLSGFSTGCFMAPPGANDVAAKCITTEDADVMADRVLQLVNLERVEAGVAPVVKSDALTGLAQDYACRMIEGGFFAHTDPESGYGPGERAVAGKYLFWNIGENLAAGQTTAADVMRVWMDSPSHRENLLDPRWTEVGIAVRNGGADSIYWVQEFGDPVGN